MVSLKDQLKALQEDSGPRADRIDADNAELDGVTRREADTSHYLDVGPSKLRAAAGADTAQTLLSDKYGGQASSRMKIFDDDEDEEEEEEGGEGSEDEGDEDEEDEEDDEDDEDEDEDEDDEEEEEDEDEEDEEDETSQPGPSRSEPLDPVGALRQSRAKDIEKGRGIKRQRDLFDTLLTMRITFQKAVPAAFSVPPRGVEVADDAAGEVEDARAAALKSLGELNETLFGLREKLVLPGVEVPRKRRRTGDADEEGYWTGSAADAVALNDAAHAHLVPILSKWSTKIQAASIQLGAKHAGGSKFMQAARGTTGVLDAIDASLASKRDTPRTLLDAEEAAYRALLREVIESRQGGGGAADILAHRREKKKKRDAERGASKGRKLRFTVHDKAANFVVPVPLPEAWHEEQVDELFASLFGGIGLKGAVSHQPEIDTGVNTPDESVGTADLAGLRVF